MGIADFELYHNMSLSILRPVHHDECPLLDNYSQRWARVQSQRICFRYFIKSSTTNILISQWLFVGQPPLPGSILEIDLKRYHMIAVLVRETHGMLVNQRKAFCQLEAKLLHSNSGSHLSHDSDMTSTASGMQSLQMAQ